MSFRKIICVFLTASLSFGVFCQEKDDNEINLYDLPEKEEILEMPAGEEIPAEDPFSETEETQTDSIFKEVEETQTDSIDEITEDSTVDLENESEEESQVEASHGGYAEVPPAKRPRPIDAEKAEAAAAKDEGKDDEENFRNTIKYGLPSEIGELLDKLIKNEDPRFTEEIYDLFQDSKNASIQTKVLTYFTNIEDPCLEDFAVNLLNDPYDEKKDVVKAVFKYIQKVKTKAALPPIITLVESENEDYFNDALATIGEIGDTGEAIFLAEYLEREDLSDAQRQTLMSTLGKIHAVETFDKVVSILEDDDENTFVRMYAAESLGFMEKKEAVPVLISNYSASDPNLRQYVIKGLANFPDVVEAKAAIVQAVRDEHWKVRQEAIKAVQKLEITEAVPFLIYRAKNDSEKVIKDNSYDAIAKLNTQEGNDFLISIIKDKKAGDSSKTKATSVLLKEGYAGEEEILELAQTCLDDDRRKNLRYALGKELAKNPKDSYETICLNYLSSKDATTVGLGLDMFKNNKFASVEFKVREIANDKKANAGNRNRAKKLLNIEDEEDETKK